MACEHVIRDLRGPGHLAGQLIKNSQASVENSSPVQVTGRHNSCVDLQDDAEPRVHRMMTGDQSMRMNRDYLDLLRRLRTVDMTAHARREAQRAARRAVLIVEVLARLMDDRDWGGGRLVLKLRARLRGFSRALRNAQTA
jgi:hypothetical protein